MNKWIFGLLLLLAGLSACKSKKKAEDEKKGEFFSVLSLLQAEVKRVEAGAVNFLKIERNGTVTDTNGLTKEQFRAYAQDFLMIPDISTPEKKKRYDESNGYDKTLNSVLYTYTTRDPDEEVRRETVMFEPDSAGQSRLSTIIIDWMKNTSDSTIEKNMAWYVNSHFQVITKSTKGDGSEQVRSVTVKWE